MADGLFTTRQNLAEICTVPDKIISVYSLEKHVWADSNSEAGRKARTRQQGITPEEIANSVLIERDADANPDENNQHYETIADNLKKELRQIVQAFDEEKRPRYRFDPVFTGVDPRDEFSKARDEAESNEAMQKEAWDHLLALDEWPVRTRQMTIDLSSGVRSTFRDIAPFIAPWEDKGAVRSGDQNLGRPERHHRGQQQDPSRRLRLERRARKGKRAKMSTHCSMIADDANYFKDFRS